MRGKKTHTLNAIDDFSRDDMDHIAKELSSSSSLEFDEWVLTSLEYAGGS